MDMLDYMFDGASQLGLPLSILAKAVILSRNITVQIIFLLFHFSRNVVRDAK
jgi:hypothetical protein